MSADPAGRPSGVLGPLARTVVFVLVVPFSIVVLVPALFLASNATAPEGWAWFGLVPMAIGAGTLLVCFAGFVLEGRGTPGPWDPPRRLVTGVLYAHVRNPIYLGVLTTLVGEAILVRSLAIAAWALFMALVFHAFVVIYEEPTLHSLFGESYDDYRSRVPALDTALTRSVERRERLTKKLRFATQTGGAPNAEEWVARARRIEALGYDTLAMPDHVVGGAWSSMPALAALVPVTTKLRLGNLVIDNDFRNPVVFAREVATLDVISGGRYELGLGAGWLDRDYQGTGITFDRGRVRVARLAEAVTLMKRLFTEEQVDFSGTYYSVTKAECRPKTVQQPHPPLMIAGGGREILALAAREANIVAIVPAGITGSGKLAKDAVTLETLKRQAELVRSEAGEREDEIEFSMFLDCVLTDDRKKTIAQMAEVAKVDAELIAHSAYRGIGTIDEIREHVRMLRQEVGMSYFCLRGPDVEKLGPIVSELTGK